jgi:hypothetical protein
MVAMKIFGLNAGREAGTAIAGKAVAPAKMAWRFMVVMACLLGAPNQAASRWVFC